MKILIVDDDFFTRTLLDKILTKHGYEVAHVSDGAKALQLLKTGVYRIVLTDWIMPEMDGLALCRLIREAYRQQYIYIILLTAKSAKEDAVAGLESGADDYIVKPFNSFELLARIRAGRRLIELEDTTYQAHLKLSRSEKAAALGHLAAGVAHEINNPVGFISSNLNSLKSYVHDIKTLFLHYRELAQRLNQCVVQKDLHPDLPGMIQKVAHLEQEYEMDFMLQDTDDLINDCSAGAERIKSIVHEMRYFAHPEKQVFEPCSLSEILGRVAAKFLPKLPPGVTLNSHANQLPSIACNASHIEQAFANIIQNAVEAIGSEGQITVSGSCSNGMIEIKVADTGPGIAPSNLPMVFDPFFTTKQVGQGVGLGLTTASNIIKMHNGSITCDSVPGKLTCFAVSLPLSSGTT